MFALTYKKIDTTFNMDYKEGIIRTPVRKNEAAMRSEVASQLAKRGKRRSPTAKVIALPLPGKTPKQVAFELIESWSPQRGYSDALWQQIRPTVIAHVRQADPPNRVIALRYLRVMTRHVAQRLRAGDRIDDLAELLTDESLSATYSLAKTTGLSDTSRGTELSYLRHMRLAVFPKDYKPTPGLVMKAHGHQERYTDNEIRALLTWVRGRGFKRVIRIHAALLLSLGAGLNDREIPPVRGIDIACSPWGLVVLAPGAAGIKNRPPRIVPVLARFENELAELALISKENPLIGAKNSPRLRRTHEMQPEVPGTPNFHSYRARSNWMRYLLEGGVSYVALRQVGASVSQEKTLAHLSDDLYLSPEQLIKQIRMGETDFIPSNFAALTQWNPASL